MLIHVVDKAVQTAVFEIGMTVGVDDHERSPPSSGTSRIAF
jgi:hypothetical protein